MTILNQVVKKINRLQYEGKKPDSVFMNAETKKKFIADAAAAYQVTEESIANEGFLGVKIFEANQYRGEEFRIYCAPEFHGEL